MNSLHFRREWKYYASCPMSLLLLTTITPRHRIKFSVHSKIGVGIKRGGNEISQRSRESGIGAPLKPMPPVYSSTMN
jgi:hypothetical protein